MSKICRSWADNSGRAKEFKQRAPCIIANVIHIFHQETSSVLHLQTISSLYCRKDTLTLTGLTLYDLLSQIFTGIPLAKLVLITFPQLPLGNLGD